MTSRQEKFVRLVAAGKTQRAAYREAYPRARNWKDAAVDGQASRLAKSHKVSARLRELSAKAESAAVMSRQSRLETLSRIAARTEQESPKDAIAAIKVLNEMTGDNAPVKAETTIDILTTIAQRHRDVLEDA